MTEKLTPERAVRLLRAKGAELEAQVLRTRPLDDLAYLAADIALVAQLLADFIERSGNDDWGPTKAGFRSDGPVIADVSGIADEVNVVKPPRNPLDLPRPEGDPPT